MFVDHLSLLDYRTYAGLDLALTPGLTVFAGPNGVGKTNIVEAVDWAASLASHRVSGNGPLIATGLGVAAVMDWSVAVSHLLGAAIGFVGLWALGRLYHLSRKRDGLGGGDPFLFAGAGAWVGWMGLPSVLLWACTVSLSLVFGILMIRRTVSGSERLPFGVFLAVGI